MMAYEHQTLGALRSRPHLIESFNVLKAITTGAALRLSRRHPAFPGCAPKCVPPQTRFQLMQFQTAISPRIVMTRRSPSTVAPNASRSLSTSLPDQKQDEENLPISDSWLGIVFLQLLPGYLFYTPSFLMPLVTASAAIGAMYGPHILSTMSTLPMIRDIKPVSALLIALGTQQPWAGLASIFLSLGTVWYAFGVMPALDFLLGRELRNSSPSTSSADEGKGGTLYRGILYAYVVIHYAVVAICCHLVCTQTTSQPFSAVAFVGALCSCGVANGIGFTVAHELLHGAKRTDRLLSNALLALFCYMHWSKSHLLHHVKVATEEDPSTARRGESLWAFIPRSIWGNLVDGYGAEAHRRSVKHIPFFHPRNRALWWLVCPALLAATATAAYGALGLGFFMGQALVGVLMLETVNYIEHYGLVRTKVSSDISPSSSPSIDPGDDTQPRSLNSAVVRRQRYSQVEPCHSWNASTMYTNSVAFHLQRHSDHHARDRSPYQLLRNVPEAPQLPAGYPAMMLLATVPPLWFRVMEPLIEKNSALELKP